MWGRRRVYCTAKGKQWHLIRVCHNITWNKPHKKNGRNLISLYHKQYLDCHLLGLRKSHVGWYWWWTLLIRLTGSGESPVLLEACWGHPSRLAPGKRKVHTYRTVQKPLMKHTEPMNDDKCYIWDFFFRIFLGVRVMILFSAWKVACKWHQTLRFQTPGS